MNDRQSEYYSMLGALKHLLDKNTAIWSGNAGFAAAYQSGLADILPAIAAALGRQSTKTVGYTLNKRSSRVALEAATGDMAARIAAYALTARLPELKLDAHLPKSTIKAAKDDALVGMAQRIAALATAHLAALAPFGVSAATVAGLSAESTAYTAQIGVANRIRQSSREGTTTLATLLQTAREKLKWMDAMMVLWKESHPQFYSMYFEMRDLRKVGHRQGKLELQVTDTAGLPLQGVRLQLPGERLMRKTSARGVCRVQHLPEGAHKAKLSATGYRPLELDIKIYKAMTNKLKVVMEKEV